MVVLKSPSRIVREESNHKKRKSVKMSYTASVQDVN